MSAAHTPPLAGPDERDAELASELKAIGTRLPNGNTAYSFADAQKLIDLMPRIRAALQQPDERDAQIARLREAAAAFIAKFDECRPHIDEAFMHRQLRAGDYTGPQLGEELEALRAALKDHNHDY